MAKHKANALDASKDGVDMVLEEFQDPCFYPWTKDECAYRENKSYQIYVSYPLSNHGKEIMYPFLDEGNTKTADLMLEGYDGVSDRFEPVQIGEITWKEDPYQEKYWRFIFYSLRPLSNLLYSYRTTSNEEYQQKIVSTLDSFLENGMSSEYSWDHHTAAFRTMALINIWWKLRENNALPERLGIKIIEALEKHGAFLVDEKNYDHDDNHGVTEAAALYLLGHNFPDLKNAPTWQRVGQERLENGLNELVDNDGALVENSPYYHFYVLRFYWNIYHYTQKYNLPMSKDFSQKIEQMIHYGTYILQPDSTIPTIGASLSAKVANKEEYHEMATTHPEFLYIITEGKQGSRPTKKSIQFPIAGQTIMRSGWGETRALINETYLYFDYGPYRTSHSDLDALSFHLYSNGEPLLIDSGLYTYDRDEKGLYFEGTKSHNTVLVDNQNQQPGSAQEGLFQEGEWYTYQSAKHELYAGVTHKRTIILLEHDTIAIIDLLTSQENHNYTQLFHVSNTVSYEKRDGAIILHNNKTKEQQGSIIEIKPIHDPKIANGITSPYEGWCSSVYKIEYPCTQISYSIQDTNTTFVTLIGIGKNVPQGEVILQREHISLNINTIDQSYSIEITNLAEETETVEVARE